MGLFEIKTNYKRGLLRRFIVKYMVTFKASARKTNGDFFHSATIKCDEFYDLDQQNAKVVSDFVRPRAYPLISGNAMMQRRIGSRAGGKNRGC